MLLWDGYVSSSISKSSFEILENSLIFHGIVFWFYKWFFRSSLYSSSLLWLWAILWTWSRIPDSPATFTWSWFVSLCMGPQSGNIPSVGSMCECLINCLLLWFFLPITGQLIHFVYLIALFGWEQLCGWWNGRPRDKDCTFAWLSSPLQSSMPGPTGVPSSLFVTFEALSSYRVSTTPLSSLQSLLSYCKLLAVELPFYFCTFTVGSGVVSLAALLIAGHKNCECQRMYQVRLYEDQGNINFSEDWRSLISCFRDAPEWLMSCGGLCSSWCCNALTTF